MNPPHQGVRRHHGVRGDLSIYLPDVLVANCGGAETLALFKDRRVSRFLRRDVRHAATAATRTTNSPIINGNSVEPKLVILTICLHCV